MKHLVGGLILLVSVNSTSAVAANDMVVMNCLSESGETFSILVKDNDAAVKWPTGTYPAKIAVKDNLIYLLEPGEYGSMAIVYDMQTNKGVAVTKFNTGKVVTNNIECVIN